MPDSIDLNYAIGLPPEKAIEYFASKGYRFTWNWQDMVAASHNEAFTVAKVMKLDILQDIRGMIQKSLDTGMTVQDFQKQLEPMLRAKGWWGKGVDENGDIVQLGSPWRLKTIYQTNMQSAYMAGREQSQLDNVNERPYWQYVSVMDRNTRPNHAALNGLVFRYDDPFWDSFYPPNGFNCRCRVRNLTQEEVMAMGINRTSSEGRYSTGVFMSDSGEVRPDEGWVNNPLKSR